jgi:uncharacterized protein YajQ (UPF0234 family)
MAPIMSVGGIIMALREDVPLTGTLLVIVPLVIAVIGTIAMIAIPLFRSMQKRTDRINQVMREKLSGVRVIRAFVRTEHEEARFDQANKELSTRFDFKGSDARVEQKDNTLTLYADDDFKLSQVTDILTAKLAKRGVDVRALKYGDVEKVSGNKVKQVVTVREGIEQELAKKVVKLLKDSKLKVQASIQGDAVRVSGAKKDDLQEAIALTKKSIADFPLQYQNFRD